MRQLYFFLVLILTGFSFALSCNDQNNPGGGGGGGGGGGPQPLNLNFGTATNLDVGSSGSDPQALTVGDLNGDGKLDIAAVAVNEAANDVQVYLGKGDGTFETRQDFTGIGNDKTLVMADLSGDGKMDLAASNGTSIALLINDGSATLFGAAVPINGVGNGARTITAADLNGTTGTDLILSNDTGNNVTILLNDGTGAFPTMNNYDGGGKLAGPRGVTAADFNGGRPDLALANFNDDGGNRNLSILFNDENAVFNSGQNFPASTTNGNGGVAAADFDGDGDNDVVVSNLDDDKVYVFLNGGGGNFGPAGGLDSGNDCGAVAVADFDKDGKLDIVAANAFGQDAVQGDVAVFLGNGDGSFDPRKLFSAGSTPQTTNKPRSAAVGDLNGDQKPDIILLNDNPGFDSKISILLNTSS